MPRQLPGRPDGKNPLIYTGSVPNMVTMARRPTVKDYEGFELGYWWIVPKTNDGSVPEKEIWILVGKQQNIATWKRLHGGGGPTNTFIVGSQVFTTPGAGTYTPTNGMKQVYVECIGGGGSGFLGANTAPVGGGGGGYCAKLYTAEEIGTSKPYFIGSGGASYGSTTPPGNNGEDTTFGTGSTLITAQGGKSATITESSGTPRDYYFSPGGDGVGGDLNITGEAGEPWVGVGAGGIAEAFKGGDSQYGIGGYFTVSATFVLPENGQLYGGGGGSTVGGTGSGAQGMIKITEYFA